MISECAIICMNTHSIMYYYMCYNPSVLIIHRNFRRLSWSASLVHLLSSHVYTDVSQSFKKHYIQITYTCKVCLYNSVCVYVCVLYLQANKTSHQRHNTLNTTQELLFHIMINSKNVNTHMFLKRHAHKRKHTHKHTQLHTHCLSLDF